MSKKIAVLSDFHCGHRVGLTPTGWLPEKDENGEIPLWAQINKAHWTWYAREIARNGPYDIVFVNGDLVDGKGKKSGSTELLAPDMEDQSDMATKIIRMVPKTKNCKIVITRGCLTAGHKILTADLRYVPVETLKAGDELFAFEENPNPETKRRLWKKSTVISNGEAPSDVYKIHLSDGSTIEATKDHPFLIRSGAATRYVWTTVEEMMKTANHHNKTTPVYMQRFLPVWTEEESQSYEAAYLSGFFDGEGALSQRKKPRRNCKKEYHCTVCGYQKSGVVLEKVKSFMRKLNISFNTYDHDNREKADDPCYYVRVLGGIRDVLRMMGIVRPQRLLEKLDLDLMGCIKGVHETLEVTRIEHSGVKTIYELTTSTGTYVSDGFLSHNTPYHVSSSDGEDWENVIAERVGATVTDHAWVEVEGIVFDLKHHPAGSSGLPHGRHTGVAKDRLWNAILAAEGEQTKADILIRSHVHYHNFAGGPDWIAMTTPALQGAGSKFGARRCSGKVDFGFITFTVDKGTFSWKQHIAKLVEQKAPLLKL
jgi:hypothetical protein